MARRYRPHRERQVVAAAGIVYVLAVVAALVLVAIAFVKLITH